MVMGLRSYIVLFSLLCVPYSAFAARINVEIDRDVVEADESFALEFSSDGAVDDAPDFKPLEKDFRQLGSTSTSSSIQIINGRMSRQSQWVLHLMPKRSGKLVIPSIQFGKDKSQPLAITVNAVKPSGVKNKSSVLHLETEVDRKTAYVQAQIVYVMRIYQAVNLLNATISELKLNDPNATVEKIGDDATFEKRISGRRFKVFEKRFAIFPQKSGDLVIEPAVFEGQYIDSRRALRTKLLKTEEIVIRVKAKPLVQTVQNNPWLPLKSLQLKEQWPQEPPVFKVGEPVTRTLILQADGLMSSYLPELHPGRIKNMKQYPDQPSLTDRKLNSGIIGTRQEKIAMIPTQAGRHLIPEIEIPWWNVEKDRLEYVRLPKREIKVIAGSQATDQGLTDMSNAVGDTQYGRDQSQSTQTTVETLADNTVNTTSMFWLWVSVIAIVGWAATAIAWWLSRASGVSAASSPRVSPGSPAQCKSYENAIKASCDANDAAAVKQHLLQWGQCFWLRQHPTSLGELSKLCSGDLSAQINKLSEFLYAREKSQWHGARLWRAFNQYDKNSQPVNGSGTSVIAPLHQTISKQIT